MRSLSLETIAVSTGCPPRKGDIVEIELNVDSIEVVTPAAVLAVTPPEAAELLGAFGFGASFVEADAYTRRRLRKVLVRACEQNAFQQQPPRRRHPRFPVCWPLIVGVKGRELELTALDISERGMFVASLTAPRPGALLDVTMLPEMGGAPLRANAWVTRVLDSEAARSHRVPPGFGLEIISMTRSSAQQFWNLVQRVSWRSGHRVLLGAGPQRLPQLTAGLGAVGYAVSAVSGTAALSGKASIRSLAPDLVVIDSTLERRCAMWVECDSRSDRPPSVRVNGEPPAAVWKLADSVLLR